MNDFLQGNLSLVVGAVLTLVLICVRAASSDKHLRRDLRGALVMLSAFLVLRTLHFAFGSYLPLGAIQALRVCWMLAFAFGVIRGVVSITLHFVRFGSAPTPKILRDVIDFALYTIAALPILKSQLQIDLTGVLATSAILSVVLGFALQDTLGNLFAGLSIQLERPFQVGDYITVQQITGKVVQIAWRATRIETFRQEVVAVPNNIISKEAVQNYSRGFQPIALDLEISTSLDAAPNHVKATVLSVLQELPSILRDPPAVCRLRRFDDSGADYLIRFFVGDFALTSETADQILSLLWYRFRREGIEIPHSTRTLHIRNEPPRPDFASSAVESLVKSLDLFQPVPAEEREQLAREFLVRRFGAGERVITAGAPGDTFYLVGSGQVSVRTGTPEVEVTRLAAGQYFGEMSLLTGEPRAASVVAVTDTTLLELNRSAFARLFAEHPGLARRLSALLAERRTQLRAATQNAGTAPDSSREEGHILGRLRQIFGLAGD